MQLLILIILITRNSLCLFNVYFPAPAIVWMCAARQQYRPKAAGLPSDASPELYCALWD